MSEKKENNSGKAAVSGADKVSAEIAMSMNRLSGIRYM